MTSCTGGGRRGAGRAGAAAWRDGRGGRTGRSSFGSRLSGGPFVACRCSSKFGQLFLCASRQANFSLLSLGRCKSFQILTLRRRRRRRHLNGAPLWLLARPAPIDFCAYFSCARRAVEASIFARVPPGSGGSSGPERGSESAPFKSVCFQAAELCGGRASERAAEWDNARAMGNFFILRARLSGRRLGARLLAAKKCPTRARGRSSPARAARKSPAQEFGRRRG